MQKYNTSLAKTKFDLRNKSAAILGLTGIETACRPANHSCFNCVNRRTSSFVNTRKLNHSYYGFMFY